MLRRNGGLKRWRMQMNDVNHPNHYTWRGTECTKAVEIMTSGASGADAMYIGNIVKYLYRYPAKGTPLKDLMKAKQYLDFLITNQEVKAGTKNHGERQ
jgi:hypothetical protein